MIGAAPQYCLNRAVSPSEVLNGIYLLLSYWFVLLWEFTEKDSSNILEKKWYWNTVRRTLKLNYSFNIQPEACIVICSICKMSFIDEI